MAIDSLPDDLTKSDGHGVANHPTNGLEVVFVTRFEELVRGWKRLKNRALAQREGSVLFRVSKATVAIAEELCGDSWGGFPPFHSAIDTGVGLAGSDTMAIGNQFLRPVSPCTARFRSTHAAEIQRRKSAAAMKWVC